LYLDRTFIPAFSRNNTEGILQFLTAVQLTAVATKYLVSEIPCGSIICIGGCIYLFVFSGQEDSTDNLSDDGELGEMPIEEGQAFVFS